MFGFRARFTAQRLFNPGYRRRLGEVLAKPWKFYAILLLKLPPGLHVSPVDLELKDGKKLRIREFWALFLFDEIFVENCYDAPGLLERGRVRTVIDVGANIGFFSIRAQQLWPGARTLAVEPQPANF